VQYISIYPIQNQAYEPLPDIRIRNALDFIRAAVATDVVLEVKPHELPDGANSTGLQFEMEDARSAVRLLPARSREGAGKRSWKEVKGRRKSSLMK
jgi:hypothetical protein